jgi:hypothetical protein
VSQTGGSSNTKKVIPDNFFGNVDELLMTEQLSDTDNHNTSITSKDVQNKLYQYYFGKVPLEENPYLNNGSAPVPTETVKTAFAPRGRSVSTRYNWPTRGGYVSSHLVPAGDGCITAPILRFPKVLLFMPPMMVWFHSQAGKMGTEIWSLWIIPMGAKPSMVTLLNYWPKKDKL